MTDFETKDSGERQQFDSGMQRDTEKGKPRFDLLVPKDVPYDEQLLTRFAKLLGRGAEKYTERNWEQADSQAEIERARSSAFRHFFQWLTGETDEDHAAAVLFNIMVVETITRKLERQAEEGAWGSTIPLRTEIHVHGVSLEVLDLATGGFSGRVEPRGESLLNPDTDTTSDIQSGVGDLSSPVQESLARRDSSEIPTEDLRM